MLFKRQESQEELTCPELCLTHLDANRAGSTEPSSTALQQVTSKQEKGGETPSSVVISLEQDLLFQHEQHKAHLPVHMSVVEETPAGTKVGESSRNGARCGHSHETEKGLQRETCALTNHSLRVYRQITHQGTVNGRFSSIRASGHPKESLGSKPQMISLPTHSRVTLWFSPPQWVAENKNMCLKRDEFTNNSCRRGLVHTVAQIKSSSREARAVPEAGWAEQGRSCSCLAKTPTPRHRQVLDQMFFCPKLIP